MIFKFKIRYQILTTVKRKENVFVENHGKKMDDYSGNLREGIKMDDLGSDRNLAEPSISVNR